jgi:hypothetical protein
MIKQKKLNAAELIRNQLGVGTDKKEAPNVLAQKPEPEVITKNLSDWATEMAKALDIEKGGMGNIELYPHQKHMLEKMDGGFRKGGFRKGELVIICPTSSPPCQMFARASRHSGSMVVSASMAKLHRMMFSDVMSKVVDKKDK